MPAARMGETTGDSVDVVQSEEKRWKPREVEDEENDDDGKGDVRLHCSNALHYGNGTGRG